MLADFENGIKRCSRCKDEKPLDAFSKNRSAKDGLAHNCKDCSKEISKNSSYERDPVKRAAYMKEYHRKRMYDLTNEEVDEMLLLQNFGCAICKEQMGDVPDIDHNHETGAVRGLLCRSCNVGLGLFNDDPDTLTNAILYLLAETFDIRNLLNMKA